MNILIVTLAMTSVGQGTFYNTQDVGLGRALAESGHTIDIYNFVGQEEQEVFLSDKLHIHYLRSRSLGKHSLHTYSFITSDADAVICFSDNQIGFKRLKKRCDCVGVRCYPYVGVLGSHSVSRIKRAVTDRIASNRKYYRTMPVFAKTPQVKAELEAIGAKNVTLAPVGLDKELLHKDYAKSSKAELRQQLGLPVQGKVILYLARMTQEKRPLEMLDIFSELYENDRDCHLVAIGKGDLQDTFKERIQIKNLISGVTYLEQVPNSDIWKYFCASDVMVNLNTEEIFGMAILEAMYYGCPVVARRAPGPDYLIENGTDGVLCGDDEAIKASVEQLLERTDERALLAKNAHAKTAAYFLWNQSADIILKQIQGA